MFRIQVLQVFIINLFFTTASCQNKSVPYYGNGDIKKDSVKVSQPDSLQLDNFIQTHPEILEFSAELKELYKKRNYQYIWFDNKGLTEFANAIYNRANQIGDDGIAVELPYKKQLDTVFSAQSQSVHKPESDFLISTLYLLYTNCVYTGLDADKSMESGWLIPREKRSYVVYLDSIAKDPSFINKNQHFSQYYNLKKALRKYRDIEKMGGWKTIAMAQGINSLKPGDSSVTIQQVRTRLFLEGYLGSDSYSHLYDKDLQEGVISYKKRHNRLPETTITQELIKELNINISERIKTITVNMERCRWLSPALNNPKDLVAVNIPSYRLHYLQNGKPVLTSNVVVGKELTKTVVFSGEISYIAFSPYWNVPESILEKEILPAIKKDPNYLAEHNMEWNGNKVRQKPGGNNSLGLVKFMFPNSNNIYLHDTPAKSLERAFSHGCIRIEKARELAIAITANDGNWTAQKVDAAMNAGSENIYRLKNKIPVYIGYFTAWADENGNTAFYEDIYNRDERLAELLYVK